MEIIVGVGRGLNFMFHFLFQENSALSLFRAGPTSFGALGEILLNSFFDFPFFLRFFLGFYAFNDRDSDSYERARERG